MDENRIQLLHEDLTEEFHALARSHTTAIKQFLEEFNDDQMLLKIEAEDYEQIRLQVEPQLPRKPQLPRLKK